MLTEKQKQSLKNDLLKMKESLTNTKEEISHKKIIQETSGELSMYDNHPADMGTALYEREKDLALHEHAESEFGKVDTALEAIDDGAYGKCSVCHREIPFERLEAVPYTLYCIDHAEELNQSISEDVALNFQSNPFEETKDSRAIDFENSFKEVAEFGSSDSPSDFVDSENPTYSDEFETNIIDGIIAKSVTDQTDE